VAGHLAGGDEKGTVITTQGFAKVFATYENSFVTTERKLQFIESFFFIFKNSIYN
jgi:hypothetical protein